MACAAFLAVDYGLVGQVCGGRDDTRIPTGKILVVTRPEVYFNVRLEPNGPVPIQFN
jgi:hypothetical protein